MTNRLWSEAFVDIGDQLNVVTDNGRTIINDTDVITSRMGIRLHALITNRLNLIFDYNRMEKESRYTSDGSAANLPNPVTYKTQNLTVTLLWTL